METRLSLDYSSVFSVVSGLVEVGLVVLNSQGEMDFVSDRARSLLDCTDATTLEACHPSAQDAIREMVRAARSDDTTSPSRNIQFEAAGKILELYLETHPIDEDSCSGYLVLVKDGDSMRKMATDLGLAAQFRNTRRLYSALVRDLKQPISVVLLHADMIRENTQIQDGEEEQPRAARSLETIRNQMAELNHSLTLLLEEIAPSDTEERGFSLRDVLKDVARLIEPTASAQDVEVKFVAGEHAARLNGYRQRVKQALLNVAVNALDAMPEGGVVRLELRVSESQATITVSDTGKGIAEDVLGHIFEMHYTTKETGTGVGLYVARDVIRNHSGEITVETQPEKGATFRIALPISGDGS